jgi:hypothetical protein
LFLFKSSATEKFKKAMVSLGERKALPTFNTSVSGSLKIGRLTLHCPGINAL